MAFSIVVVEESEATRLGIEEILHRHPPIYLAGLYGCIQDAIRHIEQHGADVLLLGESMGEAALRTAVSLICQYPDTHLIVITAAWSPDKYEEFAELGVLGFISRNDRLSAILPLAIEQVRHGELYLSPVTVKAVTSGTHPNPLNRRQMKVLRLMARNYTPQEIAAWFSISVGAVYAMQQRIRIALDVRTTAQIVREAQQRGWIEDEHH